MSAPAAPAPPALRRRLLLPALSLALVSPLVGEYLLGNVPVRYLWALPFLVPMYGGGALLVREAARRTGRGWPTILLLGAAYGVVEAGLWDGSLFAERFDDTDMSALWVPALGISGLNSLHFVVGHAVWSIAVPVALVEGVVPDRRRTPWLGRVGLVVAGAAWVLGGLLIQSDSRDRGDFHVTPGQAVAVVVLAAALAAVGMLLRPRAPVSAAPVPRPLVVGAVAFVASAAFVAHPESWWGVAAAVVLLVAAAWGLVTLARRTAWGERHRLAVAGGALVTYACVGFVLTSTRPDPPAVDYLGNALFAAGAVALLVVATRRTAAAERVLVPTEAR